MAANLDASRALDALEQILRHGEERERCREAIVILKRWEWDRDLDDPSRARASSLIREFGRRYSLSSGFAPTAPRANEASPTR